MGGTEYLQCRVEQQGSDPNRTGSATKRKGRGATKLLKIWIKTLLTDDGQTPFRKSIFPRTFSCLNNNYGKYAHHTYFITELCIRHAVHFMPIHGHSYIAMLHFLI
jgi:hypothetical protein